LNGSKVEVAVVTTGLYEVFMVVCDGESTGLLVLSNKPDLVVSSRLLATLGDGLLDK
jgi:hypothetical protein